MCWRQVILLVALASTVVAEPVPPLDTVGRVGEDPLAATILAERYIRVDGTGSVAVPCASARAVFAREDLLDQVQAEYARLLAPGEKPEFVVSQTAPGTYAYTNRKEETSVIRELLRGDAGDGERFEVIYHVNGQRFFGTFRSLIHVQIAPAGDADTTYRVVVYAYPESALPRFFARHLGLVERYFHGKTSDMEALATRICTRLFAADATSAPPPPQLTQTP